MFIHRCVASYVMFINCRLGNVYSLLCTGRTAVQLCADPRIVNLLPKTFHISAESPSKKSRQDCTMLEKQMIFGWAVNACDIEKLFLKLQVLAALEHDVVDVKHLCCFVA